MTGGRFMVPNSRDLARSCLLEYVQKLRELVRNYGKHADPWAIDELSRAEIELKKLREGETP
jgi:hypothetical protein